ncbi:MAG: D-glycerate dehydrogenase, partial [Candidatus Pacearchaeota archaeon]|nr:D-glycerate dehydrogenase [Candidatus Pacearchaeota archaeon]
MKPFVFVTKDIPEKSVKVLQERGYAVRRGNKAGKEGKGASAILCLLTDTIDGKTMDAMGPHLKVISNMAAGLDNIDIAAA